MQISIITASYNYENYIRETIESVLAQTYTDWELIIVDDGSEDNSVDVIRGYCEKDSRIRLYRHQDLKNHGLGETIQLGIEKSNNDWIVFLEADDTISADYLAKKLAIIEQNPQVGFIFNDVKLFGNEERIKEYDEYFKKIHNLFNRKTFPCNLLKDFAEVNLVPTFSCVMVRKKFLLSLDFNSPVKPLLDYYLLIQIAKKTDLYYLPEKLTNWRMHKGSYVTKTVNAGDFQQFLFKIKRKRMILTSNKFSLRFLLVVVLDFFDYVRRQIIRIHLKEHRIFILGRWYELGGKNA